ncbi:MAG TPA: TIGR03619 family F420-dependent LLM class oxidoreductase [Acidimicrobiales bacterium]|nr:TIGR03619 family F420-dependent LLM class oxidoreductase [Acidimicrobiales bacterium]
MAETLRFGFVTDPSRRSVEALEAFPIVESLWVGGHVAAPNPTPEAMNHLARLVAVAERARVGTAVLLLPLYPPAIVAKQVADLDRAAGGRVTLGVGVGGEYPAEFDACQVPVAERGPRTDEAIGLLRRLWADAPVDHDGPFYPMHGVHLHPPPLQPGGPPIVVAGRQPVAMRRAGTLGDGWMPYLYSPNRYAESVGQVRAAAQAAGRDLATFEWMVFLFVAVAEDRPAALEQAAAFLGGTYRQDFSAFVERVSAAGTPADVATRLQEYVDAGARHFVIAPASRDDRERELLVGRLVDELLPALRLP